jgi:hypothetical protein
MAYLAALVHGQSCRRGAISTLYAATEPWLQGECAAAHRLLARLRLGAEEGGGRRSNALRRAVLFHGSTAQQQFQSVMRHTVAAAACLTLPPTLGPQFSTH